MLFVGVKLREGRGHGGGTIGQAGVQGLRTITATSMGLKACKHRRPAELFKVQLLGPHRWQRSFISQRLGKLHIYAIIQWEKTSFLCHKTTEINIIFLTDEVTFKRINTIYL